MARALPGRRFPRIIFLDQSRHRPEERQSLLQIPDDLIMTQAALELYEQDVHRNDLTRDYAPARFLLTSAASQ